MTNYTETILEAQLLDEAAVLHVDELCARLHVGRPWIVELVELGALEPRYGEEPSAWAFPLTELPRLRSLMRLVDELGVNPAGAAIILELAEERRRLLAQLRQWTAAAG